MIRSSRTAATLPVDAQPLLPHFTQPTAARFVTPLGAAIVNTGRRTVVNLLRTVGGLASGQDASYRRVRSAAHWSGLALGCALARHLLDHLVPACTVYLVGDDTVDGTRAGGCSSRTPPAPTGTSTRSPPTPR